MKNATHEISSGENFPKSVNAIIEIPKDSKIKFEIDKETGLIKVDRFLYSSVHYPGDYGFIPQTHWEDGDPLDMLVLTGTPVYPGVLASARVIGVIHMNDNGESDDKILAVYEKDPRFSDVKSINDVPKHTLNELKHFFETYKELENKKVKVLEIKDKEAAYEVLKKSVEIYRKKFGKN
ncbi:inorganic diphosphatase [Candidatus Pacearchaeota archaeon]|nr:inorganic diphosphatase [Candidatus Pacearchaeota archaeon]